MGEFEILPGDRLFRDSPDVGEADCLCSRCGKVIGEDGGVPIRAFVDDGRGGEYRYHPVCLAPIPTTMTSTATRGNVRRGRGRRGG
jgi:hypothetical protein